MESRQNILCVGDCSYCIWEDISILNHVDTLVWWKGPTLERHVCAELEGPCDGEG
jgi:hypothetical protein